MHPLPAQWYTHCPSNVALSASPQVQPQPGVFDERVFRSLDWLLAEAAQRGLRLLLNLTNYWKDYGGMAQYVEWACQQRGQRVSGAELNGHQRMSGAEMNGCQCFAARACTAVHCSSSSALVAGSGLAGELNGHARLASAPCRHPTSPAATHSFPLCTSLTGTEAWAALALFYANSNPLQQSLRSRAHPRLAGSHLQAPAGKEGQVVPDPFYTDPDCQRMFRAFLHALVHRTNSLTGIMYR